MTTLKTLKYKVKRENKNKEIQKKKEHWGLLRGLWVNRTKKLVSLVLEMKNHYQTKPLSISKWE